MISLLVPTMNRSPFLERLLGYYAATGFTGTILIGDSSDDAHFAATRALIARLSGKLQVVHQRYPGLNNAQCIHLMLKLATTPYAAFIADDDFLVPASLDRCVQFLAANPDYSAAHGVGISLVLDRSGPWGRPVVTGYYAQAAIGSDTALSRLEEFEEDPQSVLFCVHRTDTWREMYAEVTHIRDIAISTEILPCYVSVALGKVKALAGLHLVRQLHDQQYIYREAPIVWMTRPEWQPAFETFCRVVAATISHTDGIDPKEAHTFVEAHYRRRLVSILASSMPEEGVVRRVANRIAGAVRRRVNERGTQLHALLRTTSHYYSDFAEIYRAVTERART
jgi:glycosyltransferase domain-containing protein